MIDAHLRRQNQPGLPLDAAASNDRRLHEVSSQIMGRRLLTRDLVITGNCLTKTDASLPSDLYFSAAARSEGPPPFGDRGVNLAEHPEILLDAVMGSGTIFPVFPAHTVHDFPKPGQQVEVDLRSKLQVVVFTMTPEPPHICLLDFAENLTDTAIQRGYLDARGYRDQNDPTLPAQPTFRKELGEPVFARVPAEPSSP